MLKLRLVGALVLLAGAAQAQTREPSVHISAVRDPVDKSYRKIMYGMEIFDRYHGLAPNASLRFQLLTRKPGATLDGIALRIVGDTVNLMQAIAADKTFTVALDKAAYDEDASMVLNRKNETVTWRAQVISPGLPAGARRLGDLRLGCRVGVAARTSAWSAARATSSSRIAPSSGFTWKRASASATSRSARCIAGPPRCSSEVCRNT